MQNKRGGPAFFSKPAVFLDEKSRSRLGLGAGARVSARSRLLSSNIAFLLLCSRRHRADNSRREGVAIRKRKSYSLQEACIGHTDIDWSCSSTENVSFKRLLRFPSRFSRLSKCVGRRSFLGLLACFMASHWHVEATSPLNEPAALQPLRPRCTALPCFCGSRWR